MGKWEFLPGTEATTTSTRRASLFDLTLMGDALGALDGGLLLVLLVFREGTNRTVPAKQPVPWRQAAHEQGGRTTPWHARPPRTAKDFVYQGDQALQFYLKCCIHDTEHTLTPGSEAGWYGCFARRLHIPAQISPQDSRQPQKERLVVHNHSSE